MELLNVLNDCMGTQRKDILLLASMNDSLCKRMLRHHSIYRLKGLGSLAMRCCAVLLAGCIAGCCASCDELEVADGVKLARLGIRHSCVYVSFCDRRIEGDLHLEFLGDGVLVSRWDFQSESYDWSYVDLRNRRVVDFSSNDFPMELTALWKTRKSIRSYCPDVLMGESRIDVEYAAFVSERETLKRTMALEANTR